MDSQELIGILASCSRAIGEALRDVQDWGPAGTRPGQYRSDLVADAAGVRLLVESGLGVLSEESGVHHADREYLAVIDPLDGSTNASRGVPWFATSICVLDDDGPVAALVEDRVRGAVYTAVRGAGAWRDGARIAPAAARPLANAVVAVSGLPPRHLGWAQFRAMGAIALDLCAVADGVFDAYIDCVESAHGPWDYLAGLLICTEAGGVVAEVRDRPLVARSHGDRRSPVAASSPALLDELRGAFRGGDGRGPSIDATMGP